MAYLLGMPLLADFLKDGLERLGISVEEAERGASAQLLIRATGQAQKFTHITGNPGSVNDANQ